MVSATDTGFKPLEDRIDPERARRGADSHGTQTRHSSEPARTQTSTHENYTHQNSGKHLKRAGVGLAGVVLASAIIGAAYHGASLYNMYASSRSLAEEGRIAEQGVNPIPVAPVTHTIVATNPFNNQNEDVYAGRTFDELYCAEDPLNLQCVWDDLRDYSHNPEPAEQPTASALITPAPSANRLSARRLSAIQMPDGKGRCFRLNDGSLTFQFVQPYAGFKSDRLYATDAEGMRVLPELIMQKQGIAVERRDDCFYHAKVQPGVARQSYNPIWNVEGRK